MYFAVQLLGHFPCAAVLGHSAAIELVDSGISAHKISLSPCLGRFFHQRCLLH